MRCNVKAIAHKHTSQPIFKFFHFFLLFNSLYEKYKKAQRKIIFIRKFIFFVSILNHHTCCAQHIAHTLANFFFFYFDIMKCEKFYHIIELYTKKKEHKNHGMMHRISLKMKSDGMKYLAVWNREKLFFRLQFAPLLASFSSLTFFPWVLVCAVSSIISSPKVNRKWEREKMEWIYAFWRKFK